MGDIERIVTEAGRRQPDLKSLVSLPQQFQRLENRVGTLSENVELVMPNVLALQKDIAVLTSGGPASMEWNLQYSLSEKERVQAEKSKRAQAGPPSPP
eukprot:198143-Rhodomonas_salina.1